MCACVDMCVNVRESTNKGTVNMLGTFPIIFIIGSVGRVNLLVSARHTYTHMDIHMDTHINMHTCTYAQHLHTRKHSYHTHNAHIHTCAQNTHEHTHIHTPPHSHTRAHTLTHTHEHTPSLTHSLTGVRCGDYEPRIRQNGVTHCRTFHAGNEHV